MTESTEINHQEIGRRLTQVREAAGIKQAELARKITWSPAVLSRIESGERPLAPDELKTVMEAIGTPEALQLSDALAREWREIPRPPLDHADQELLWQAEQVCRDLVLLSAQPEVRHAFEQRLTEYINDLRQTSKLLLRREHDIVFIGSKGIGKSTCICKVCGLEVDGQDGAPAAPVLEAGGGGVTVCDVYLRSGHAYGLIIEPCSDDEIRAYVTDFADHILQGSTVESDEDEENEDDAQGIAQEIARAVRNLAHLKVRRDKGPGGKRIPRDEAKELAAKTGSLREYVVEILTRMELHRRDRRDIWYDPSVGKSPMAWLKDTFEQVNNGRHEDFTLPNRIEVTVPRSLLDTTDLSVRLIDTRGVDRTAARADLERHFDEPHTLVVLCSSFNDAPSSAAHLLLERAKEAGVRRLELNAALLVLPHAGEALAVKDEAGIRAETVEDGYELKEEYAAMALQPLGLKNLTIGFFNAFGDDPARLRNILVECLGKIRQSFRLHMEQSIASARSLLQNHEKEQVQEVLRAAARMMNAWVTQNSGSPKLSGHVQDSLMSQLNIVYASTVRATVRRAGEWRNLSYGHHLGYGARRLAVLALGPLVDKFKAVTELLEASPEYAEAADLVRQARGVLESAFEDLLRKAQIMGQTAYKEAIKLDPSIWIDCEKEWGQGAGYRNRVVALNREWFNAKFRQELEEELWDDVKREWSLVLARLSSLLEADGVTLLPNTTQDQVAVP